MPHLLRLLYVSRATDSFDPSSINDLLEKAQIHNALAEVTGVLCWGRGYFIQALEGSESSIIPLYAKVLKDDRHRQPFLLSIDLVSTRAFPSWSMAYVDGEALGTELHARLVSQTAVERDVSASVKLFQSALKSLRRAS